MRRRAAALSVAAAVLVATSLPASAAQPPVDETLVMPFEDRANTPTLSWMSEGSAVLLAELLERYGRLTIIHEERLSAFDRLQLPPAAALSHATVIKVGQFVGADDVVVGTYQLTADRVTVRARSIQLGARRMAPEIVEQGHLSDIFAIYDRVARRLRGATTPAPAAAPGTLLSSLHGFELYVKGMVAEAPASRLRFLEQAHAAAPADDRISLAIWQVQTEIGNHAAALAASSRVPATSLLASAARYLTAKSLIELRRFDEAFATLKSLLSTTRSAEVLNAIGIVQLRRGATEQTGRAIYYFNQASQLDGEDPDYFFNLGYAYWLDKDPQAAIYWLRETVRRDPADRQAHLVLAAALQQTGATTEAARERELAGRLAGPTAGAVSAADPVLRGLERLKAYLDRPVGRVNAMLASTGQRDQAELATHHLDAGRRAFEREADREAEQELRRALYLSPYLADAHLLLGRVYVRLGRTGEAIQAFRIALWSEESVEGHVRLAEAYVATQNITAAREEVARALALDPKSAEANALRDKIGR